MRTDTPLQHSVERIADELGGELHVHAQAIDHDIEIGYQQDVRVALASVFKLAVLVEIYKQGYTGQLDLAAPVRVDSTDRTFGPTGISLFEHPCELSVRDLSVMMMTISDNTATDVLLRLVGRGAVNESLRGLGLHQTVVRTDCAGIMDDLAVAAGLPDGRALPPEPAGPGLPGLARKIHESGRFDARKTNSSSPRECSALLRAIWLDRVAPAPACAEMRRILRSQAWSNRLRSAFPSETGVAAKTGTLLTWRNEVGVIEPPDGAPRVAVAIFLNLQQPELLSPRADRAIAALGRQCVEFVTEAALETSG